MKKFQILGALMLVATLTLFSACSKDEPTPPDNNPSHEKDSEDDPEDDQEDWGSMNLTLDRTQLTLDYGQIYTLKASINNCNWTSSNDFVASVDDNGVVTAKHEGATKITVTKGDKTASCRVVVNATNFNFNTILTWGWSQAQIKSNLPYTLELLSSEGGNLLYSLRNEEYPWYGFFFQNGGLVGSSIWFTDRMYDDYGFKEYIDQRYEKLENTDKEVIYIDAYEVAHASISVTVEYVSENDVWMALWQPVGQTKGLNQHYKLLVNQTMKLFNSSKK